ncbi:MAG TPA: hypothetical protein VG672_12190 [Bryobacteraceae bacterium]|nr:hypothetical protein [Bryobacteraceae bacterium]
MPPNFAPLTRRDLFKTAPLLASPLGPSALSAASGKTVRDRFWLWSHVAGSYNGQYNLPKQSRITPAEAAFYLSIPNVFMIQLHGQPDIQSLEQYAVPFQSLEQVAWSIVDPQETTPEAERRAVLDFAFKTPNITGVVMDDFFVKRKTWKPGQVADLSLDELRSVRQSLQRGGKRLDLWVVLYEHQIAEDSFPTLVPHLELCDVVQVWIWHGKNVPEIGGTLDRMDKLLPKKRRVLGCFMWDFGAKKPMPIAAMEQQCETGLKLLRQGRIEGIIFCGSWLCDRGLETVDWTRRWIHKVGGEAL